MCLGLPENYDDNSLVFRKKKSVYSVFLLSQGCPELIIRIFVEETIQYNHFINSPGNSIQSPRGAQRMRAGRVKVGLQAPRP